MRTWILRASVTSLAVCAVSPSHAEPVPVTNATVDTGDPAVFALVNKNTQVRCTATVIAPHTAITAGHCVADGDPRTLRAFFGTTIPDGTLIDVTDARTHPGFDPGGRDIAVLTLRDEAPVAPVEIEPMTLDASLVGTQVRVVGFGLTAQGVMDSGTKRVGTASVAQVQVEEVVAVPDPSLSCLGDSGGPALLPAGTIAGVVSRGDAMCQDHAVYTRIDAARAVLVDPYLADTAPGTASLGEPCFYDDQCRAGACVPTDDDPLASVCAEDSSGGCGGCASSSRGSLWPAIAVAMFAARRKRRRAAHR